MPMANALENESVAHILKAWTPVNTAKATALTDWEQAMIVIRRTRRLTGAVFQIFQFLNAPRRKKMLLKHTVDGVI